VGKQGVVDKPRTLELLHYGGDHIAWEIRLHKPLSELVGRPHARVQEGEGALPHRLLHGLSAGIEQRGGIGLFKLGDRTG